MKSPNETRGEGSAEEINVFYDRQIKRATAMYGGRLASTRPMSFEALTRQIVRFNSSRAQELGAIVQASSPAAVVHHAAAAAPVATTPTTGEELTVHEPPADADPVAAATTKAPKQRRTRRWWRKPADFVEPAKPRAKGGRPTNAAHVAEEAAQHGAPAQAAPSPASGSSVPARATARSAGSAKPQPPAPPTAPEPVVLALPRFNRDEHILVARAKGDELVRLFQAGAVNIAKIRLERLPAASAKRAVWVQAATGLHNRRVVKLNELEAATIAAVDSWRAAITSDLSELKSGLMRVGATRVGDHLMQVDGWLRFLGSQADGIKDRLGRLHNRWLQSIKAALENDIAGINKRFPPGSEPEDKRGGPARKYDQDTGRSTDEAEIADVA